MLKREIQFEDFNGNETSEIFYFNITKPELLELEVMYDQGFGQMLENIVESNDRRELVKRFKEIVLLAYGQKSDDGKHFIKSDKIREEFSQSAAYPVLFMELATDDTAAATFLKGVLPKDIGETIDVNAVAKLPQVTAPTPPVAPVPPTPPNS